MRKAAAGVAALCGLDRTTLYHFQSTFTRGRETEKAYQTPMSE